METHKSKNDSVFFGMFPSNEPAPQPVPAPPAHKPAASEEQVAVLNKKIELLERTIAGQAEKKLSERVPSPLPPPPPPPGLAPAVILKMTEMENRLKDFQEKFMLGAAQIKNIEESKISARREIEELLKVVREQQKYTELDRQMHDQLEKAWSRVEAMEKRMLEVYSAAAKKPAEPAVPAASPGEIAAAVLKIAGAGLEERLAPLEAALRAAAAAARKPAEPVVPAATPAEIAAAVLKAVDDGLERRFASLETALKSAAAKLGAAPDAARSIAGHIEELSASIDARLAGLSLEVQKLHADSFAGNERLESVMAELKKGVFSSIRSAFADSSGESLRRIDAVSLDGRDRMDALGKLLIGHLDELTRRGRDSGLQIDALERCVRAENEKVLSGVSSVQHGLEKVLLARIDDAAARVAAENSWQLEKIKEAYGLSVSNTAAIAAVTENIVEIEGRLGGVLAGLKAFVKAAEPVNLAAVLGVSGAIIRRSLESAGELIAGLEKEAVLLAGARGEIEGNLKHLAAKPGGEAK